MPTLENTEQFFRSVALGVIRQIENERCEIEDYLEDIEEKAVAYPPEVFNAIQEDAEKGKLSVGFSEDQEKEFVEASWEMFEKELHNNPIYLNIEDEDKLHEAMIDEESSADYADLNPMFYTNRRYFTITELLNYYEGKLD